MIANLTLYYAFGLWLAALFFILDPQDCVGRTRLPDLGGGLLFLVLTLAALWPLFACAAVLGHDSRLRRKMKAMQAPGRRCSWLQ